MRSLPATSESLASPPPATSAPGTIFVLGPYGGVTVEPEVGATVSFGRNLPEVDVGVGVEDDRISRRHGVLLCAGRRWSLRNVGRLPIRLPSARMIFPDGDPVELTHGYTPLFIKSPSGREHLLEIRITGPVASGHQRPAAYTNTTPRWKLSADERLVLVALGQRCLRHEEHPPRRAHSVVGQFQPDDPQDMDLAGVVDD